MSIQEQETIAALTIYGEDFVNREPVLRMIIELFNGKLDQRLLLIGGETGIGKSYLLGECFAQCAAQEIAYVQVDLADDLENGYLSFVARLAEQVDLGESTLVEQALIWANGLGSWPSNGFTTPIGQPTSIEINAQIGHVAERGQLAVGTNIAQIQAEVVNLIHRDDPRIQEQIEARVTAALRETLLQLTTKRLLVFYLDSWEQATTPLRRWLSRSLLHWIVEKRLPNALAIVAGLDGSDLPRHPTRIERVTLAELDAVAFRTYWVDKRKLPADQVDEVYAICEGMPLLMQMIADRHARKLRMSHPRRNSP